MENSINTDAVLAAELLRDFAHRAHEEEQEAWWQFRRFDRAARELENKIYPLIGAVERGLDRGH
jgi:hypothetical protein